MIQGFEHLKICYSLLDALKELNVENKILLKGIYLTPLAEAIIKQLSQATEAEFFLPPISAERYEKAIEAAPTRNQKIVEDFVSNIETLLPLICKLNEL